MCGLLLVGWWKAAMGSGAGKGAGLGCMGAGHGNGIGMGGRVAMDGGDGGVDCTKEEDG